MVLLAAPLAAGVRSMPADAFGLLVVPYAATAVFEEGLWRGVMIGLLHPTGIWRAVLISSVLFGLGHLGNSALRRLSPLIAAQSSGAAVQGVGFAALRLRTNTIWPLIIIHALHDLFLQMGVLPIPLVEVPIDTLFASPCCSRIHSHLWSAGEGHLLARKQMSPGISRRQRPQPQSE